MTYYLVDVCPQCKQVVTYCANPAYIFVHSRENGGCGFKGYHEDLIRAIDIGVMESEKISLLDRVKCLDELKEEFPSVINNKLQE